MAAKARCFDNSEEDDDLHVCLSFEELRFKSSAAKNPDNSIVIDCDTQLRHYPSNKLKRILNSIASIKFFKYTSISHDIKYNNEMEMVNCIRDFQSINHFTHTTTRLHRKLILDRRTKRRELYFDNKPTTINQAKLYGYDQYLTQQPVTQQPNQIESRRQNRLDRMVHDMLPRCVKGCNTDHGAVQFECTQRIRKLL